MAKSKQQQLFPATAKRKKSSGSAQVDLLGEDVWMVVKKQKVTVIIPPSPGRKQVTIPSATEIEPQTKPTVINSRRSKFKAKGYLEMHFAGEKEKSSSLIPKKISVDTTVTHPQAISNIPHLSVADHRLRSPSLCADSSKGNWKVGGCGSSKVIKRLAISADRGAFLNQRMRALILEKKLKGAGGLSNWLVSLGLDRFINIFQCKNVNKFQLACLTMDKLKNMGAYAVGPRRKLLHAIDCLCKPYYFQH